jgi:uncharacterized protein YjiS (DUF1127 family)
VNVYETALRHPNRPLTSAAASAALAGLREVLRGLFEGIARRRRLARNQAEIDGLDDDTLRDIGMHRSEAASYWAESERLAEQTRTRLLQRMQASP